MYITIAILAAIFAVTAPGKSEKASTLSIPAEQQEISTPKQTPILIDSRFSRKPAPWEKNTEPAEFFHSARIC